MAKRPVLGNDPFERGAAVRPELQPPVPPPPVPPPPPAGEVVRPAHRPPRPPVASASRRPDVEPVRVDSTREATATQPPETPRAAAAGVPTATAGEQLRALLQQRLPELIGRVGRAATEGLGLVGAPEAVPDVDPYGRSPVLVERWQPALALLLRHYFRLAASGLENIPAQGPALLVCNHSGVLPFDEVLIAAAIADQHPQHRTVRPLTEDFAIHFPFAGSWLNRFGCVRACPENAERLLAEGQAVAVFPEGSHGIGKLYRQRYQLQRFGRGGFVKLALRCQVPILPVAFLGAEEAHPVLARIDLPRSLGLPYLPVTPTFPWLGPLGLWPLPTRLYLRVGAPIVLGRGPRDAEDRPLVARLAEDVRAEVQELLDGMLAERRSAFL